MTRPETRASRAITLLAVLALSLIIWLLAALVVLTWMPK